jgi:hypothetical protein
MDHILNREPGFGQDLDLALVTEAGHHAAVAGGIEAGEQQPTGRR